MKEGASRAIFATWKTRIGWVFAAAYLGLACVLFYQAFTCTGWVCDFVALPVVFPLGFPIAWLTDLVHKLFVIPGHTPSVHLRNWTFIAPTVLANAAFYFWLGRWCSAKLPCVQEKGLPVCRRR